VKVPIVFKIAAVAVLATGFYTYVGQLVPQKEVLPPVETKMAATMTTAELVATGKTVVEGKGSCLTCHTIGRTSGPFRFPDLAGVGERAAHRVPGFNDIQYFAQTLYQPNVYIVPGFSPGMPTINKPPIGLTDDEIKAVIAYLQSLGGTPTVTMQTAIPYAAGGAPPGATESAAAAQAAQAPAATATAAAAGAAAVPAAVVVPVPAAPRPADVLLTHFQCGSCHNLDKPGRLKAESLADIGARKREPEIVAGLAAHPPTPDGFEQVLSLAETRALARYLAAKKGSGA
jgi:mono/diheme cytochrome c family protein